MPGGDGFIYSHDPDSSAVRWRTQIANVPDRGEFLLFRTTDGGLSWQDITSNLPIAPLNDVLIVNTSLLVASDLGVFATDDDGRMYSLEVLLNLVQPFALTPYTVPQYPESAEEFEAKGRANANRCNRSREWSP